MALRSRSSRGVVTNTRCCSCVFVTMLIPARFNGPSGGAAWFRNEQPLFNFQISVKLSRRQECAFCSPWGPNAWGRMFYPQRVCPPALGTKHLDMTMIENRLNACILQVNGDLVGVPNKSKFQTTCEKHWCWYQGRSLSLKAVVTLEQNNHGCGFFKVIFLEVSCQRYHMGRRTTLTVKVSD